MDSPSDIRRHWQQRAANGLPARALVNDRNKAITTRYAKLYLDSQPLFKWAGLAVFASDKVGEALLPYELVDGEKPRRKDPTDGLPLAPEVADELDMLRNTNNNIYEDIAWAHFAYTSPEGGLSAVIAGLEDLPCHQGMLDGFQKIEEGRRLLDRCPERRKEATNLIWHGNSMLLQHEQTEIVQKAFAPLAPTPEFLLSQATALAFAPQKFNIFTRYQTHFATFMYTHGLPILLRTRSWPHIQRLDQRWFWITKSALKLWRSVDRNLDLAREAVLEKAPDAAAPSSASFVRGA